MADFDHAIVIGASIGGLLAARVLSDRFTTVTVFERDVCPKETAARPGAPQGRQTHALLPAGANVLDNLFPGRLEELVRDGSTRFDYGHSRFNMIGKWKPIVETGLFTFAQTRPFLEEHLRRWVSEIRNVRVVYETPVLSLLEDRTRRRVTGVETAMGKRQGDLTVDASGRGTRLPRWLEDHGYGPVPETRIELDLAYTTGLFRVPVHLVPKDPLVYVVGKPPLRTRAGALARVENGLVIVGLAGYHGDHPPGDLDGILAFAKELGAPDFFRLMSGSELVSPLARYRFPRAVRRQYRKMKRFPAGVLPIGDAACCLDPVFGQGMTVAALEAQAMGDWLKARAPDERDYLKRMDRVIETPWDLARGENLKYPQTVGQRPLSFHLTRHYRDRLGSSRDEYVTEQFYRVLALMSPARSLLKRRVIARAFLPQKAPRYHV